MLCQAFNRRDGTKARSTARMLVIFYQTSKPGITFVMSKTITTPKTKPYDLNLDDTKHIKAMSIEELRASEYFQNRTEDELISMIDTVRTFTEIVYSAWAREAQDSEQNTTIIPLQNQQRTAA